MKHIFFPLGYFSAQQLPGTNEGENTLKSLSVKARRANSTCSCNRLAVTNLSELMASGLFRMVNYPCVSSVSVWFPDLKHPAQLQLSAS